MSPKADLLQTGRNWFTSVADGILMRWVVGRRRGQHHVVPVAGRQLLDDLLRLERIDLGFFLGADLRQQLGVDILAVRDRRFRDRAPALSYDHLAPTLAFGPLVVGGKADPDGFQAVRSPELNRGRTGRVESANGEFARPVPAGSLQNQ